MVYIFSQFIDDCQVLLSDIDRVLLQVRALVLHEGPCIQAQYSLTDAGWHVDALKVKLHGWKDGGESVPDGTNLDGILRGRGTAGVVARELTCKGREQHQRRDGNGHIVRSRCKLQLLSDR